MVPSNYPKLRGRPDSPEYSDVETGQGDPGYYHCDHQLGVLLVNLVVDQAVGQLGIEDAVCRYLHKLGHVVGGTKMFMNQMKILSNLRYWQKFMGLRSSKVCQ